MNNRWTTEEIENLKRFYPNDDKDTVLKNIPKKEWEKIAQKASSLKIKRNIYFFSQEEIDFLKNNYGILSLKEISFKLNKSIGAIGTKLYRMGVSESLSWTKQDKDFLKQNYATITNKQLEKIFNRKAHNIVTKALSLGLKKENFKQLEKQVFIDAFLLKAQETRCTPILTEVLSSIKSFSVASFNRYFGSYRDFCLEMGYAPNMSDLYSGNQVLFSKNGDLCLSKSEVWITNFFIDNKVEFQKEARYDKYIADEVCLKICDWVINDKVFVEFFGLHKKEFYKIKMDEKIEICKRNNIRLISVLPSDLRRLKEIFAEFC